MRELLLSLLLATSLTAHADAGALDEALAEAKSKQAPVLLDFHAPWCYSCYFMKKNVLNGPEWVKAERSMVVVEVDADSPGGAALKDQFAVKALPSYVVLNAEGSELGRISAERTRAQFYKELGEITARNSSLDALRKEAAEGGKRSVSATRLVLTAQLARNEGQQGLDWFATLPPAVQADAIKRGDKLARTLARLQLKAALKNKQPEACLAAADKALSGTLDCESPYDLDGALECTKPEASAAASEPRKAFLAAQAPRFEKLLSGTVLGKTQGCADARSAVFSLADLHEAQGNTAARADTFKKGIAFFEPKVGKNARSDRNAADNLRVFYDAAGESAKLDALLEKLVAAYPEDYVYANRYARVLAARGEHEKALPWFAKASEKAYGINRLKNAQARVQSLLALKRADEARVAAAEALKANGPWFPEEMTKLKALLPAA
ncbi:MAG: thioredoxin family protein [Pseudomonadota bacterium]